MEEAAAETRPRIRMGRAVALKVVEGAAEDSWAEVLLAWDHGAWARVGIVGYC